MLGKRNFGSHHNKKKKKTPTTRSKQKSESIIMKIVFHDLYHVKGNLKAELTLITTTPTINISNVHAGMNYTVGKHSVIVYHS